ncbi:MAG TPA: MGMT family protein [Trebonia sp.]
MCEHPGADPGLRSCHPWHAIRIWPGPLPGATVEPSHLDWSQVNAVIAAIPRGRWTTYGDLAQPGGTAAMPVGQHIVNTPGLGNAYRVLGSDGKPQRAGRQLAGPRAALSWPGKANGQWGSHAGPATARS